eukprot:tig00020556_g11001.t1
MQPQPGEWSRALFGCSPSALKVAALVSRFVSAAPLPTWPGDGRLSSNADTALVFSSAWSYGEVWEPRDNLGDLVCRAAAFRRPSRPTGYGPAGAAAAAAAVEEAAGLDLLRAQAAAIAVPAGACLVGAALALRRPVFVADIASAEGASFQRRAVALRAGFVSAVAFPVFQKEAGPPGRPSRVASVALLLSRRPCALCRPAMAALAKLHVRPGSGDANAASAPFEAGFEPDVPLVPSRPRPARELELELNLAQDVCLAWARTSRSPSTSTRTGAARRAPRSRTRAPPPRPRPRPLHPHLAFPAKRPAGAVDPEVEALLGHGRSELEGPREAKRGRAGSPPAPGDVCGARAKLEGLAGAAILLAFRQRPRAPAASSHSRP